MPSYQLLRRPVGEGGFLVVAIAAGSLPANSLPRGETRQEVGGEVGRGRGQRFNRAMRCKGTSLAISVRRTNHSSPWMPTHMQHFSLQTSTYSRTAHRLPLICTPIWRRRWRMACLEWKAGSCIRGWGGWVYLQGEGLRGQRWVQTKRRMGEQRRVRDGLECGSLLRRGNWITEA